MSKVLCIFHASCPDGLGAAWAVHRALGDEVEFVSAKYGEQHELLTPAECAASGNCPAQKDVPRSCNICDGGLGYCKKCHRAEVQLDQPCGIPLVEGRDVLIVDFFYPLPILRAMAAEARSVLVLDHHKTAREDLAELLTPPATWSSWINPIQWTGPNLRAIFDLNRSGAGLTWDYLHPGVPRPRIIDLIEDRDLWRFKFSDETRAFHAVLTSYDITDLPAILERLDEWSGQADFQRSLDERNHMVEGGSNWSRTMREGRAILRAQRQAVAAAVAASRRTIKIAGHIVPCANVPGSMASDAGHLLCEGAYDADYGGTLIEMDAENRMKVAPYFSATYYDGADGKRHFSLHSPDGVADCGAIAKEMAEKFNNWASPNYVAFYDKFKGKVWAGGGHPHSAGFGAPLGWEGE